MYAKDAAAADAKPSTVFRLYVDGQLGMPFGTAEEAMAVGKEFHDAGFDTLILEERARDSEEDQ